MNQHVSSTSEEIIVQPSEPIFNLESNYKGLVNDYVHCQGSYKNMAIYVSLKKH